MKCDKCGWIVSDDTVFCDNCGSIIEKGTDVYFCTGCGAEVQSDSTFCSVCGKALTSKQNTTQQTEKRVSPNIPRTPSMSERKPIAEPVRKDSKKDNSKTIILMLISVIILLVSIIAGYWVISGSSTKNSNDSSHTSSEKKDTTEEYAETEAPRKRPERKTSPTPKPTPTPTPTEEPDTEIYTATEVDSSGYATYVSRANGFTCKYPAWFRIDDYTDSHFACSTDYGAVGFVVTCVNSNGEGVEKNMQNCISYIGGTVDYKMSGSNYFAVRLKLPNQYYYRYSHFKGGKIYSFSVSFPLDELDKYDAMINYVYAPFREQF